MAAEDSLMNKEHLCESFAVLPTIYNVNNKTFHKGHEKWLARYFDADTWEYFIILTSFLTYKDMENVLVLMVHPRFIFHLRLFQKYFVIPTSEGEEDMFSSVNRNKYMVTDKAVYISK